MKRKSWLGGGERGWSQSRGSRKKKKDTEKRGRNEFVKATSKQPWWSGV